MSPPNRHKPPKQDPPIHYSTQHFKEDLQQKEMKPQIKNQSQSPAYAVIKLIHFTGVMNLKGSLCLRAMRWSRVSRCASIVSSRDIKLMNARKDSL